MKGGFGRLLAAALAAVALPGAAAAACAQDDLAGKWFLAADILGAASSATQGFNLTCMMRLDARGHILTSECRQLGSSAAGAITQPNNARFVLDRECNLSATSPGGGNVLTVTRGGLPTGFPNVQGRMSSDRGSILFEGLWGSNVPRLRVQGFRG